MVITMHTARITGPISYLAMDGKRGNIPLGPCLVEQVDHRIVDIIWGPQGQSSAALPLEDVEAAENIGHLVLLD